MRFPHGVAETIAAYRPQTRVRLLAAALREPEHDVLMMKWTPPAVTSVNMVEIRAASEVAMGQAARGGSLRVCGSGAVSSAMASTCM